MFGQCLPDLCVNLTDGRIAPQRCRELMLAGRGAALQLVIDITSHLTPLSSEVKKPPQPHPGS